MLAAQPTQSPHPHPLSHSRSPALTASLSAPTPGGRLIPLGQKSSEPLVLSYGKLTFKIGRNAVCDFVLDKEARVSAYPALVRIDSSHRDAHG